MRGQTKGASQSLCCSRSLNSYMTGPAWSAGIAAGPPATSTLRPHKWPEDSGLRARFGCCKRGVLFPQIPPPPAVSQSPRNRPQDARLGPAPRQRWGPAGGGGNVSGLREALRGPRCPRLCPQVTGMMGTGAGGGGAGRGSAEGTPASGTNTKHRGLWDSLPRPVRPLRVGTTPPQGPLCRSDHSIPSRRPPLRDGSVGVTRAASLRRVLADDSFLPAPRARKTSTAATR